MIKIITVLILLLFYSNTYADIIIDNPYDSNLYKIINVTFVITCFILTIFILKIVYKYLYNKINNDK